MVDGDARILLVEDDADLRDAMAAALRVDGHRIAVAANGEDALEALGDHDHDLILLDIALGAGIDGVDVCRRLRRIDTGAYVMMLTARDGEPEIVRALEAGADDYVTKPVGIAELRSRVRAALRRVGSSPSGDGAHEGDEQLRHATLTLDDAAHTVHVSTTPVELTPSEFSMLRALLVAGGAVRSRPELLEAVYGDDAYRDPRAIDVHVHHVREKLEQAGGAAGWLVTVRGAGYRLGT